MARQNLHFPSSFLYKSGFCTILVGGFARKCKTRFFPYFTYKKNKFFFISSKLHLFILSYGDYLCIDALKLKTCWWGILCLLNPLILTNGKKDKKWSKRFWAILDLEFPDSFMK